MKVVTKAAKIFFLSNLAVVGFFILLPAILITGEVDIAKQFVEYITRD